MTKKFAPIALAFVTSFSVPAAAQLGGNAKGKVEEQAAGDHVIVTTVDTEDMTRYLREEGYEVLKVDEDGDVVFKMEGVRVYMIKPTQGNAIFMRAAWSGSNATLATINKWNRGKRYSHAYLDDDGDPVLQVDLDLAGGVTEARIRDYILTTKLLLRAFQEEVL